MARTIEVLIRELGQVDLGLAAFNRLVRELKALENGEGVNALPAFCTCVVDIVNVSTAVSELINECAGDLAEDNRAEILSRICVLLRDTDEDSSVHAYGVLILLSSLPTLNRWDLKAALPTVVEVVDDEERSNNLRTMYSYLIPIVR